MLRIGQPTCGRLCLPDGSTQTKGRRSEEGKGTLQYRTDYRGRQCQQEAHEGLAQCLTFQAPPDGREVKAGQGPRSPRAQDTGSVHWIGAISVTEEKSN